MRCIVSILGNPRRERLDFAWRQLTARRHAKVGVVTCHTTEEYALLGVARHNGVQSRVQSSECVVALIKTQPGLALGIVGSVASEAVVREDGPDVAVEVDGVFGRGVDIQNVDTQN